MSAHAFIPDYAIAPGETLKEVLDDRGMSQSELALRTGLTEKTINLIVKGTAAISYETAAKFEMALNIPASFWNNRESQYRATILAQHEASRLSEMGDWLKNIPVKVLVERGYVEHTPDIGQLVHRVLQFFGVSSVSAWEEIWLKPELQFRGGAAHDSHPGIVAAWVRMGELWAQDINCKPYDKSAFLHTVKSARRLTILPSRQWYPELLRMCAEAGVVFALIKEIAGGSVSGVTKWISKDKAVLMLSLKYKRDDQFWFSFFHEACHVLEHGKKQVFYERGMRDDDPLEKEANQFARNILIPPVHATKLPFLRSKQDVTAFAAEIGISPGIVVGRLHHDEFVPPTHFQGLKRTYKWPT